MNRVLLGLVPLAFTVAAHAQVPRGWAVSTHFVDALGQVGGVSMWHPLVPGTAIPIVNLPPAITGVGLPLPAGADSVLVHPVTGNIVVGTITAPQISHDLHFVTLTGGSTAPTAAAFLTYNLCSGGWGVTDQMAWVGDDILVCNRRGPTGGPLSGFSLGWVRPRLGPPGTSGTVAGFPLSSLLVGTENALAVDAPGQNAFVATFSQLTQNPPTFSSRIYRIPLTGPSPAVPVLLSQIPDLIAQLALAPDGLLLAATVLRAIPTTPLVYAIDPATGIVVATNGGTWPLTNVNGLAVDPVTGDLLLGHDPNPAIYRSASLGGGLYGPPILLTIPTLTTLGCSGIALRPALSVYGSPTAPPGSETHTWVTSLCPGGGPSLGNPAFGLTIDSAPGTFPGLLALSLGTPTPAPIPVMGVTLLLDPASIFGLTVLLPQTRSTVALPIPNNQTLVGLDVFAQTMWMEAVGLTASDGLWFTIY